MVPTPLEHVKLLVDSAESPALIRSAETPAYEVKFLLTEELAQKVAAFLLGSMQPDPHGDPRTGGGYLVSSVYFDTTQHDVFHRNDGYRRKKYRIRRYGEGETLYLERKAKKKSVKKKRVSVSLDELGESLQRTDDWEGRWFSEQLERKFLVPTCLVTYERQALIGLGAEGPIRVTFDRHARGKSTDRPLPMPILSRKDGTKLLEGEVITEFKFLSSMPVLFKNAIEELQLSVQGASKYRRCAGTFLNRGVSGV